MYAQNKNSRTKKKKKKIKINKYAYYTYTKRKPSCYASNVAATASDLWSFAYKGNAHIIRFQVLLFAYLKRKLIHVRRSKRRGKKRTKNKIIGRVRHFSFLREEKMI